MTYGLQPFDRSVSQQVDARIGLGHVESDAIRHMLGNQASTDVGSAKGTNAGTIKTAAALDFTIEGVHQTQVAATDNIALTGDVQPASSTYLYTLAHNGTAFVVRQGRPLRTPLDSDSRPKLPAIPLGETPCAVVKVVTAAGTTFTPGTTNVDAAGVTSTFYDVRVLPDDDYFA